VWWPELVSSYAIALGDDFVSFDPLSVPDELRERATAVVLTAPYHETMPAALRLQRAHTAVRVRPVSLSDRMKGGTE